MVWWLRGGLSHLYKSQGSDTQNHQLEATEHVLQKTSLGFGTEIGTTRARGQPRVHLEQFQHDMENQACKKEGGSARIPVLFAPSLVGLKGNQRKGNPCHFGGASIWLCIGSKPAAASLSIRPRFRPSAVSGKWHSSLRVSLLLPQPKTQRGAPV